MGKRLRWILVVLVCLAPVFISGRALADVNDFVITDFNGDYYLTKQSPHGKLNITETIAVDFHDYNHGILRAIPDSYKNHPLHLNIDTLTSNSGAPDQYTTYKSGGNTVLRIGNPNHTVTGPQSYTITYSLQNVITFYADHDELFWDINGDQWGQPFQSVAAHFHIPPNLSKNLQEQMRCYTGTFGSTSQDCQIQKEGEEGGALITATAQNLPPHSTLSVVLAFNKGTFAPYTTVDWIKEHKTDIILAATTLIFLVLAFRRWWQKGKDPKGAGVIVPQYGPPKGVSVLDAGLLQDYRLDNKDITAIIIDLAVRGYITIIEEDKKTLWFKSGTSTKLVLNKTDATNLKDYELTLLQTLFKDFKTGGELSLGKYQSGMSTATRSIGKYALERLTKDGLFDSTPQKSNSGLVWLYILITGVLVFIAGKSQAYIAMTISIVAIAIEIILLAHMPRRTKQGALYNDDLKGLKLYLKTAEADRIKYLQSPNAKYAEDSAAPVRTVKLFEKLLPYAIIFGVEKDWAKQFNDLLTEPPDWYQGNWTAFNAGMLVSHINSTSAVMNSTFSPPSSSGGSGFSGGGAGGGGGGGGGGGW